MKDLEMLEIVDSHAHIFTQDMPLNDQPRHSPTYDFTLEDYLSQLDQNQVSYGVIAAASPCSDYNDYIIESVHQNPRLRGTVIVKPSIEKYILEFMQRDGIVGIRLPFIGLNKKPDLTTFEYRRLLKRLVNLDMHVHLHVEGPYLTQLLPLLENSGVKIVIDHLGRLSDLKGDNKQAFDCIVNSIRKGRTWVKASGAFRLGDSCEEVLHALLDSVGSDRLVWASDSPFVGEESKMTYPETLSWFYDRLPDADSRRKVFSENALSLYGFTNG